jgi:hypothetical protein
VKWVGGKPDEDSEGRWVWRWWKGSKKHWDASGIINLSASN